VIKYLKAAGWFIRWENNFNNAVFRRNKMKQNDMIELNAEIKKLSECGIHKSCTGSIALFTENESLVLFLNPDNYGDYAFAWVENKHLTFTREHTPQTA